MATRFYLPDTGTAPFAAADATILNAAWEQSAGYSTLPTDTVKSNTAHTAGSPRAKNSTTANNDRLDRVYVSSKQLAAGTIAAGTFSAVIRTIQSAATTDAWLQIMIRVVSSDGTVSRGVIYGGSTATTESATAGDEAQEYATSSQTRIKNALATSAVTAQAGDRIQIEIGARINGTTTSDTFTHRYGDETATADFALTAGLTTDLVPWVELSQNLTWVSAPVASFTKSVASGTAPLAVSFTDTSTGGPTSWAWDFGDGGTATTQNPSHTYTSAGTYSVTLAATNSQGSNTSSAQTVTVSAPAATGGGLGLYVLHSGAWVPFTLQVNAPN